MLDWKSRYQDWEGTASELAAVIIDIHSELKVADDDVTPNERLVRHYVQQGVLDRPERRGKEAIFGFRQVVEFLAARNLIHDGWPLAKVAEFNRAADLNQLLDISPKGDTINRAQELISQFQRSSPSLAQIDKSSASLSSFSFLDRSAELTKGRTSRREALEALGSTSASPKRDKLVRLALAPWCHVYFDPRELRKLPSDVPELLGHALIQCLIEERIRPGGKK